MSWPSSPLRGLLLVIPAGGLFAASFGPRAARAECAPASVIGAATSVPTASGPLGFAVADFDDDGNSDLAVAAGAGRSVKIHFGVGDGSFSFSRSYAIAGTPGTVLATDLNGDGITDLALPNPQDGVVEIFLGRGSGGRGDGTFTHSGRFAAGDTPGALAAGDFNGDGALDLLVANQAVGLVSALPGIAAGGRGTGAFGPPASYIVNGVPAALAVADFNEDGILDFAASVVYWNFIAIFPGRGAGGVGDGTFGPDTRYGAGAPGGIQTGDFNADGILDLVVAYGGGVGILFGQGTGGVGNGTFAPLTDPVPYVLGPATQVSAGDLDADGLADLVACFPGSNDVRWLRGLGSPGSPSGGFEARTVRRAGLTPQFIALADFNHDGRLDVATSNQNSSDISILLGGCDALPPPPAARPVGRWTEGGLALCQAPGAQSSPDGASDGTGGAIVVWADRRSGVGSDIYASRVNATGDLGPGWIQDGTPVCTAEGGQTLPRVVPDGSGGALVAWIDERDGTAALFAQRLLASGAVAPEWPAGGLLVSRGISALAPIAMDADGEGGAVIAWLDANSPTSRVFVGRITGAGDTAPGWPAGGIDVSRGGVGDDPPRLGTDGLGGAYVAWTYGYVQCSCHECQYCSYTLTAPALARVNASGVVWTRGGAVFGGGPMGWTFAPEGGAGVFFGGWRGVTGARVSRFDPAGAPLWEAGIPLHNLYYLNAAADGTGGVIFATGFGDIVAQRLGADGIAPGWRFDRGNAVCGAPGDQYDALEPVADGGGGAYFGWTDSAAGDRDLYMSRLDGLGVHASGWSPAGNPVCQAPGDQTEPRMFADGTGGVIEVWRDERGGEADIYAQRVVGDEPTPVLLSLAHVSATAEAVRLIWIAAGGSATSAALYRRETAGEWEPIASLRADGTGRLEYEDRRVRPGARYGYCLGIWTGEREERLGEVWITVPARAEFALTGPVTNPVREDLRVSFSLGGAEPAILELLDVAGRRLAWRQVGVLGKGSHVVRLSDGALPTPGIYFIRLRQGERTAIARACVLQ